MSASQSGRREQRVRAWMRHAVDLLALHAAWLLWALPVVTWVSSSAAMVYTIDRWVRLGDDRLLFNFTWVWRRHLGRTVAIGAVSALVLVLLIANLVFLMTRDSALAAVLLAATASMVSMWAVFHLSLVPVIALFPELSVRGCLREALVMTLRRLGPLIGVFLVCLVAAAVLYQLFAPLVVFGAGLTAHLALRHCYRSLEHSDREKRRLEAVGGARA